MDDGEITRECRQCSLKVITDRAGAKKKWVVTEKQIICNNPYSSKILQLLQNCINLVIFQIYLIFYC